MYSQEFIATLKEYKEGRMVDFKEQGEYLIDTPERVQAVFYYILERRIKYDYYMLHVPLDVPELEFMLNDKPITLSLKQVTKAPERLFVHLSNYLGSYLESNEDYDKKEAWLEKVYPYLEEETPDKWQALLFVNELRCGDCKKDFDIKELICELAEDDEE